MELKIIHSVSVRTAGQDLFLGDSAFAFARATASTRQPFLPQIR